MKYIDLTHTFTDKMSPFPGDPIPSLKQRAFIEKDTYNDFELKTVMHVGTHLDAPYHMIKDGKKIDALTLDQFFGPGVLLDVRNVPQITADLLDGITIPEHAAILLYTGWGDKFGTDEYSFGYPPITLGFAQRIIDLKVCMVGMDVYGPDKDTPWPIHVMWLKNNILIIENVAHLDMLVGAKKFEVMAIPPKLVSDAAPVRVIAKVSSV